MRPRAPSHTSSCNSVIELGDARKTEMENRRRTSQKSTTFLQVPFQRSSKPVRTLKTVTICEQSKKVAEVFVPQCLKVLPCVVYGRQCKELASLGCLSCKEMQWTLHFFLAPRRRNSVHAVAGCTDLSHTMILHAL